MANALFDAIKNVASKVADVISSAVSGSSSSSSESSSSSSSVSAPVRSSSSSSSSRSDSSAYWNANQTETHNATPVASAQSNAKNNLTNAQNAYDNYVSSNSGYATDPLSQYYYEQGLSKVQSDLDKAKQQNALFNSVSENSKKSSNYKTSDQLNGASDLQNYSQQRFNQIQQENSDRRREAQYLNPDGSTSAREAFQTAIDNVKDFIGNRKANYLTDTTTQKPSQAGDSFSRALENQQSNRQNIFAEDVAAMEAEQAAEPPNPNKKYEKDYKYATPDELKDMDQNDAWNPTFEYVPGDGETAYFKGNQSTPVDPYVQEAETAYRNAPEKMDLSKPKEAFGGIIGSAWNQFVSGRLGNWRLTTEQGNEGRKQQSIEDTSEAYRAYVLALRDLNEAEPEDRESAEAIANINRMELMGASAMLGSGWTEQLDAQAAAIAKQLPTLSDDVDFNDFINQSYQDTISKFSPEMLNSTPLDELVSDMSAASNSLAEQAQSDLESAKAALGNTGVGNVVADAATSTLTNLMDRAEATIIMAFTGVNPGVATEAKGKLGLLLMGLGARGSSAQRAEQAGVSLEEQVLYADENMIKEIWTENMSDGLAHVFGKGAADDIAEEAIRRFFKTDFGRAAARFGYGILGEAKEEAVGQLIDPFIDIIIDEDALNAYTTPEGRKQQATDVAYSALVGGASAIFGGTTSIIKGRSARANEALRETDAIQQNLVDNGMDKKGAQKAAPNVRKYQNEGFESLKKGEQKTLANPLIRSIYGIDVELDKAIDTKSKQTDGKKVSSADAKSAEATLKDRLTEPIYNEYTKYNGKDAKAEEIDAAANAYNAHRGDLDSAQVGDVLLDENDKAIGTITEINDYGMTVSYSDTGETESVVFYGNNGLLDPNSRLAQVLDSGERFLSPDEAKVYQDQAKARAAAAAKSAANSQQKAEDKAPQAPKAQQPTPPQEQPRNTSGEGRAEQNPPQAPKQQQTQQNPTPLYTNEKGESIYRTPQGGYVVVDNQGTVVKEAKTYDEAADYFRGTPSQEQAPQLTTEQQIQQLQDELNMLINTGASPSIINDVRAQIAQLQSTSQNAPESPQNASTVAPSSDTTSQENAPTEATEKLNSKPETKPSKAEQFFNENPRKQIFRTTYNGAAVEIKKNSDGTYTVKMAPKAKNGSGYLKTPKVIGTVNSIEEANRLVNEKYSDWGNKYYNRSTEDAAPPQSEDFRYREGFGYTIQASKEDPTLGMSVNNTTGKRTTVPKVTVSAEVVQDALSGKAVHEGAANYDGVLNEKQVANLTPVQIIQRLQNYAKKAGTTLRNLIQAVTTNETDISLNEGEMPYNATQRYDDVYAGELNDAGDDVDRLVTEATGGEEGFRAETKKKSAEESQADVEATRAYVVGQLLDSIRGAVKNSVYLKRSGLAGIADYILDKGNYSGTINEQASLALQEKIKKIVESEFRRQQKNYNKKINWKKITTADIIALLDNAVKGYSTSETSGNGLSADQIKLKNGEFQEIDALLQRADNVRVGYGESARSTSHVYTGYMDLRSILEGEETFQMWLDGKIYDEAYDEEGNPLPGGNFTSEEEWRENPKETDREYGWYDRGDTREGTSDELPSDYLDSYWARDGKRDLENMFHPKSEQTGEGNGPVVELLPTEVSRLYDRENRRYVDAVDENGNPTSVPNPRLSRQPGVDMPSSVTNYADVRNDRIASDAASSFTAKKYKELGDLRHRVDELRQENEELAKDTKNIAYSNTKIKQNERLIANLESHMAPLEAFIEKLENGYKISDFINDKATTKADKNALQKIRNSLQSADDYGLQDLVLHGKVTETVYYQQVGDGMFRQLIDSHLNDQIKNLIENHKKNIKALKKTLAESKAYVKQLNPLIGDKIKKYENGIAKLEKQIAQEEAWFERATDKNSTYTLNDYLGDPFIREFYEKEPGTLNLETKDGGIPVFSNFKFRGLANAMSHDVARDIISEVKKGVLSGELQSGTGAAYSFDGQRLGRGETITEASDYGTAENAFGGEANSRSAKERESLLYGDSDRSDKANGISDAALSSEQGTDRQGNRSSKREALRSNAQVIADEFNDSPDAANFLINDANEKGQTNRVVKNAKEIGNNTFMVGIASALNSEAFTDPKTRAQASVFEAAGAELDAPIVTYNGAIFHREGNYDIQNDTFTSNDPKGYSKRSYGFVDTEGNIIIPALKENSRNKAATKTLAHELTHKYTTKLFGKDGNKLINFVQSVFNKAGIDYNLMADVLRPVYGNDITGWGTAEATIADECLAYIIEGATLDGALDKQTAAKLLNALLSTSEFSDLSSKGLNAYSQVCRAASASLSEELRSLRETDLQGKSGSEVKSYPTIATDTEQNKSLNQEAMQSAQAETDQHLLNLLDEIRDLVSGRNTRDVENYNTTKYQYSNEITNGTTREGDVGLKAPATEAQKAAANPRNNDLGYRFREDLDQITDDYFDALVESEEAGLWDDDQGMDQFDFDSLVNAESQSEADTLEEISGQGIDTDNTGSFENMVNEESRSERDTLNDISGEDIDTDSEGAFDNLVDTEDESIFDALNAGSDSADRNYPEARFKTAKDYYGKAYDEVITKVKDRRAKANKRSSFTNEQIYHRLYGSSTDANYNYGRLQKLNKNIDLFLDGKMSASGLNAYIKNLSDRQGIAQILNDDIQKEFSQLAQLEERATGGDQRHGDVVNYQYAAADAIAHLCARMDMVEHTERSRAKLDALAKEHGATRKGIPGQVADLWNRMQITGDNAWRMFGNWDKDSEGYTYAKEHNKANATRISEEAKLKGYFSGIDKNSKEFRDFANGTTMSNVDFNGHKISLMEAVKFVKICDTLKVFASEKSRPQWQRLAALGGFAFEGQNGKPVFVDIQGSFKNNAQERANWVEERYNQAMAEIAANKSASAYMKAAEEMYWDASQDAEKVHSKVNGYERYMYGKGKYTDIHYANKNSGKIDFSYKDRDATDVHDTGIMQRRTRVKGGYVMVNPMSRSVDAYISQISNYIAYEEFGQKLGVLNDGKSINGNYANTIRDAYGSQYGEWFDNYVKSMTLYKDHTKNGTLNAALAKARQAMMSGALVGSVSVPIKQVSSFFDTMGTLDPRAVAVAFATNPAGKRVKGIKNYLMDSRTQSISDPDLAELFGDTGLLNSLKQVPILKHAVNLAQNATNMMDANAVSNVYKACVLDVQYNSGLGKSIYKNGQNFKDGLTAEGQFYVDSKFEETLLATQPIFTPQARNELARTDNQLLRMFSTFRTQQTQNYNRMLQTWNEYQAARKSGEGSKAEFNKFVQTMSGQMLASASLAALTAFANTVLHKHKRYKDDDDEIDEGKLKDRLLLDTFESMMGNGLFVGDITKWAIDAYNRKTNPNWSWKYSTKEGQYLDVGNAHIPLVSSGAIGTALSAINSAINLYADVQKDGWTDQNVLSARYVAGNMATMFGVQANNVYYALNAGYQWYLDGMQLITGDKKYEKKYDDIFTQWAKVDNSRQNRLVNAILSGNESKVNDMIADMEQDTFTNAVYYGAFDKYKQGKINESEYMDLLMNYAGKSYKEASNEVTKKKALLESGISQYNGIDGRDGRKAFYDAYSGNFQSRDQYKQFFTDVKTNKAEGKHNTYYTTYNGQQQQVSANQSSIIDTLNQNIREGNFDYNTAKLLWENYYGYSTSKYGAWKFVGK